MKFLADMGISPKTVAFLQELGHDAVHLQDLGLHQLADSDILQKARSEGRVLLAHDLDFPELMAASGAELPSVVLFRLRNMRPDRVNQYLHRVITDHQESLGHGAIFSVTEGQIRVRSLPLTSGE